MVLPAPAPQVIAHRGASAYAPEHTFAAYDLALAQGADALELDVRATAERDLVVLHDATLERTARLARPVSRLGAADLAGLEPPVRPVRLEELLARYGERTRYLIEVKDPSPAWEREVAHAVARRGLADRVVVQSFDEGALRRLRRHAPWLAVAPLYRALAGRRPDLDAVAAFADGVGLWHEAIDAALVLRAHARGLDVRAWTVNAPADMTRLLALGVDGLITDAPDLARAAVDGPAALPAAA